MCHFKAISKFTAFFLHSLNMISTESLEMAKYLVFFNVSDVKYFYISIVILDFILDYWMQIYPYKTNINRMLFQMVATLTNMFCRLK